MATARRRCSHIGFPACGAIVKFCKDWSMARQLRGTDIPREAARLLLTLLALWCANGQAAAFPLRGEEGRRCLIDQDGKEFLVHGDAAWSLAAQLTREEAEVYLRDRRARGFNAVLVNLLENKFASDAPRNAYGEPPFAVPTDFSRPNEKYFAHVDWLLRRAEAHGLLVLLAPSYLGYRGGEQGWYREMRSAGAQKLLAYGRYLGRRYGGVPNVIWVHGGDYDPPDFRGVRALIEGLREAAPGALHTFHGGRGSTSHAMFPWVSWLSVNTIYTDEDGVVAAARAARARSKVPFILIEGRYEDMGASEAVVRTQAYQAVLSGACGHVMGQKHVWPFDLAWRASLDSPGARSVTRMRMLLESLEWSGLQPAARDFLVGGEGRGRERVAAAVSPDRLRAVAYIPGDRVLTLNTVLLQGPRLRVRWIDPSGTLSREIPPAAVASAPRLSLRTPGRNGSGYGDWLLVLDSAP